ncbi:TetR/AcrR family transcriptional regulator [Paenibacillus psychroresistens]|uniref:TetR/AcrR family transcriptional regulator n=1 Tax=Paenibacillus psychroresistens TaxID=1778678 RepID=A0A6B8RFV9_9BACL|nr:TetR/AcrR family transcriptional regulator [Paenibacillus psychroresistens]QGQ94465.1 TetR/AcrR family transcriptional regulator [Paenibacillus psychroresistens]
MFAKFLNLNPDKQTRIINAAMKEFAQKGFDNASTNEIVKEAEIAKGLLFHYFKNKQQLFLFAYDYGSELILNDFYQKFDATEPDFFARLRQISRLKLEILQQFPDMFHFLEVAYIDTSKVVSDELEQRKQQLIDSNLGKLFKGIDLSLFKDGVDITRIIQIMMWTFEGYNRDALKKAKLTPGVPINYESFFAEAAAYIEFFKTSFYK